MVGEALRKRQAPALSVSLDPLAAVIANDPTVTMLIGRPVAPAQGKSLPSPLSRAGNVETEDDEQPSGVWPDKEAPSWVAVEYGGNCAAAVVRIGFRGARVATEISRRIGPNGRVQKGSWIERDRLYSVDALHEAVIAARAALRAAGCTLMALVEVGQSHGGQSAVAAIWIRALSPALRRGQTMSR